MAQSIKYSLTTPKGHFIEVDASQAGEVITTTSGETVEVPTLRELKKLPVIREEIEVKKKFYWNTVMGIIFAWGMVILLYHFSYGAYYGYYFYTLPTNVEKPDIPDDYFANAIEDMPLEEILEHWEEFQKPYAVSMYRTGEEFHQQVPRYREFYIYQLIYYGMGCVVGLGMAVVTLLIGYAKRK